MCSTIVSKYKRWLFNKVRVNGEDHSYFILLDELYKYAWWSMLPDDQNREADGLCLRAEFTGSDESMDVKYSIFTSDQPVTVLEVLIGIAQRMAYILYDPEERDDGLIPYFWELISNLGFDSLNDEEFYDHGGKAVVRKTLHKLLYREYRRNGTGGLFPIRGSIYDQREQTIWQQLNEYIMVTYMGEIETPPATATGTYPEP